MTHSNAQTQGECRLLIIDKTIVLVGRKRRSKWWGVTCTGCTGKRRKDGSCKHERAIIENLLPEIRRYARIVPA
jgi:hypothetical protein